MQEHEYECINENDKSRRFERFAEKRKKETAKRKLLKK